MIRRTHGLAAVQKVLSISKIPPPSSKKAMQSFLGKNNFVRRFVLSFSEMVKPLQNIIKKDVLYRWGQKKIQDFGRAAEDNKVKISLIYERISKLLDNDSDNSYNPQFF